MSDLAQLALFGVALITVFLVIGRTMRRREERWESEDWRQPDRGNVKVGNALLEIHSLLQPDRRHQVEEMQRERTEAEESGDPPVPGAATDRDD
jgi:hypothetical protein